MSMSEFWSSGTGRLNKSRIMKDRLRIECGMRRNEAVQQNLESGEKWVTDNR